MLITFIAEESNNTTTVQQYAAIVGGCFLIMMGLAIFMPDAYKMIRTRAYKNSQENRIELICGTIAKQIIGVVFTFCGLGAAITNGTNSVKDGETSPETSTPPTSTTGNISTDTPDPVNIPWGNILQIGLLALLGIVVLGAIAVALIRLHRSNKERKTRAAELALRWDKLTERFGEIEYKYAQAETDPATVLSRPLLTTVSFDPTRVFINTMVETRDILSLKSDIDAATEKVDATESSWYRLYKATGEIGLPGVSDADKRRADNLLKLVMDESVGIPERVNAHQRLQDILDEIDLSQISEEDKSAVKARLSRNLELTTPLRLAITS